MIKKSMLLIFNPKAGLGHFIQNLFEVLDRFTAAGFLVTAYPTQKKRDAFDIALALGGQYDYLVCSGGDGTLNEVVDAMMLLPKRPMLGYLPAGTTNDFAVSMGIPVDVLLAAGAVCDGIPREIDIGSFQEEHFSYVAAFGLFTDVSYETSQGMKNILGHMAYMLEGVKRLANIKAWPLTIACDEEVIEGEFVFGMVTNSVSIGGFRLPVGPAEDGDGFRVILLKRIRTFSRLQEALGVLTGARTESDCFVIRKAKSIRVSSAEELSWTLDGEYGGSFREVGIGFREKALTIMVPRAEPQEGPRE